MNDRLSLTGHRIIDIADRCFNRNCECSTDFLDLAQQAEFNSIIKELPPVSYKIMGGYDLSERKVIVFLPYEDFPLNIPYSIIKIEPANAKFSEELGHRDYLGSLVGLGVTRDKFGDILIDGKNAYVFVMNDMSDYVRDNLNKVRNTIVRTSYVDAVDFDYHPRFTEITGSVASLRLDAVIALGFSISRNHVVSYIEDGRVYVNGRLITTNAYNLKDNDIISVRKLGRIQFMNAISSTRKGRLMVSIRRMI